jgi:hypothetical protein
MVACATYRSSVASSGTSPLILQEQHGNIEAPNR